MKIVRYAQRLVEKYDTDGSGRLDPGEWSVMRGNPRSADLDGDQMITVAELAERVARYGRPRKIRLTADFAGGDVELRSLLGPEAVPAGAKADDPSALPSPKEVGSGIQGGSTASQLPTGRQGRKKRFVSRTPLPRTLPSWFRLRDADGDAQVTMAEFAPEAGQSHFDEFAVYDRNGDGVITAEECARGPEQPGKPARKPASARVAEETLEERAEDVAETLQKGPN